jgi:hypothetical protein
MGQTALLPLRRKACRGFFCPKNPTASAGFEPANLGTKGQHATSRPPKPLYKWTTKKYNFSSCFYGRQNCSLALRKQFKRNICDNRALGKIVGPNREE